jgi:hypothetical protein
MMKGLLTSKFALNGLFAKLMLSFLSVILILASLTQSDIRTVNLDILFDEKIIKQFKIELGLRSFPLWY